MRPLACLMVVLMLAGPGAAARAADTPPRAPDGPPPAAVVPAAASSWSYAASAYTYFVPGDEDYLQPTLAADRGGLHLEARYNYEALRTASVWAGWNLRVGDSPALLFTPIAGVVFGETDGLAPGYKGSLSWRALELYSEGEYVFDSAGASGDFFYNWSQLTVAPVEGFEFGVVTQRTRAYEAGREFQRGLLLGFSHQRLDASVILFGLDSEQPLTVIALALAF